MIANLWLVPFSAGVAVVLASIIAVTFKAPTPLAAALLIVGVCFMLLGSYAHAKTSGR